GRGPGADGEAGQAEADENGRTERAAQGMEDGQGELRVASGVRSPFGHSRERCTPRATPDAAGPARTGGIRGVFAGLKGFAAPARALAPAARANSPARRRAATRRGRPPRGQRGITSVSPGSSPSSTAGYSAGSSRRLSMNSGTSSDRWERLASASGPSPTFRIS